MREGTTTRLVHGVPDVDDSKLDMCIFATNTQILVSTSDELPLLLGLSSVLQGYFIQPGPTLDPSAKLGLQKQIYDTSDGCVTSRPTSVSRISLDLFYERFQQARQIVRASMRIVQL